MEEWVEEFARRPGQGPFTLVVRGAAGNGKTALVTAFARLVADRHFRDGQVYASLNPGLSETLDQGESPVESTLLFFIRALSGPDEPRGLPVERRRERYRALSEGRRILVFLDDVAGDVDIGDLMPADPDSVVVLTAPHPLPIRPDAEIELGPLSTEDARAMLAGMVGQDVADSVGADELLLRCENRPLAIQLVAAVLSNRTDVAGVMDHLARDHAGTAPSPSPGGAVSPIEAALNLIHGFLTRAEREVLRSLAALEVLETQVVAPWMVQAILSSPEEEDKAEILLQRLAEAGLVERLLIGYSRAPAFRLNHAVRDYAARLTAVHDGPEIAAERRRRLLEARQSRLESDPTALVRGTVSELLWKHGSLDRARWKARAAVDLAKTQGNGRALAMAYAALAEVSIERGHGDEGTNLARYVIRGEDPAGGVPPMGAPDSLSRAHRCLAKVLRRNEYTERALYHLDQALRVQEEVDDPVEHARVLMDLSVVQGMRGDAEAATASAPRIRRTVELRGDEVEGLGIEASWSTGLTAYYLGRHTEANTLLERCLEDARRSGFRLWEAWTLLGLARSAMGTKDHVSAARHIPAARSLFFGMRHDYGVSWCDHQLAKLHLARGRPWEAEEAGSRARAGFQRTESHWALSDSRRDLERARRMQRQAPDRPVPESHTTDGGSVPT